MAKCASKYSIYLLMLIIIQLTCSATHWYSPQLDSSPIATVHSRQVKNFASNVFTSALVSNNSGLTTNLSFTATTDQSGTQVTSINHM